MQMPIPHTFNPGFFAAELVFTIIAVAFCFLIYFKTREIYALTKHEGIKYFRGAFFFFGLSYVVRFLFGLVIFSMTAFDFIVPRETFGPLFILLLGYFSTIGIVYLIFSSVWKKFKSKNLLIVAHGIAILLSIVSFIARSHLILLYFQSALLILAVILSSILHKLEKKISKIRVLYFFVSVLWLINLWVIDRRRPFSFGMELFFQLVSLIVFIVIYLRISKWVK